MASGMLQNVRLLKIVQECQGVLLFQNHTATNLVDCSGGGEQVSPILTDFGAWWPFGSTCRIWTALERRKCCFPSGVCSFNSLEKSKFLVSACPDYSSSCLCGPCRTFLQAGFQNWKAVLDADVLWELQREGDHDWKRICQNEEESHRSWIQLLSCCWSLLKEHVY